MIMPTRLLFSRSHRANANPSSPGSPTSSSTSAGTSRSMSRCNSAPPSTALPGNSGRQDSRRAIGAVPPRLRPRRYGVAGPSPLPAGNTERCICRAVKLCRERASCPFFPRSAGVNTTLDLGAAPCCRRKTRPPRYKRYKKGPRATHRRYGQSPGSAAVLRKANHVIAELRGAGGHCDGECAADHRDARSLGAADRDRRGVQVINSSPDDLAPVFDAMLEKAMRLCESSYGLLATYDGDRFQGVAAVGFSMDIAKGLSRLGHPPPDTVLGGLVRTKEAVQMADISAEPSYILRRGVRGEPMAAGRSYEPFRADAQRRRTGRRLQRLPQRRTQGCGVLDI